MGMSSAERPQTPLPIFAEPPQRRVRGGHRSTGSGPMSLTDRLHALDRRQQRRPRLSFLAAVVKKFSDDRPASWRR